MVTADQLRFCKVGAMFYSSCNNWDCGEWDGKEKQIECLKNNASFNGTINVYPEEFTASVLTVIETMFPDVAVISKVIPEGIFLADNLHAYQSNCLHIMADIAPWLDEYMFEKIEGKWVQS